MKFRFKIQQYQTDAVESTVRVFEGQPKVEAVSYRRDIGVQPEIQPVAEEQLSFLMPAQVSAFDAVDDSGFLNERLHLDDETLLNNIRTIQTENNIRLSDSLIKTHGRCSLDVEM
ncbi:MAG: restriction endonuclease subunit R, partial [Lachnospiraceae bacterium]|nr:restriction endonuclease subunit R [Lachnospiraceae bacterium]